MTNLETYFADTLAAGWSPRKPATDPAELATLEQSIVRGDCIYPLLIEGDTVYVDRNARPEPGDVVSFALSQRGADAQNSALPAGQSHWSRGDRWCKLYDISHGLECLYDRHGSEATATLMSCEHPDDTPILNPVRNIRRGDRLLFGPESHGAQIGLSGATSIYQVTAGTGGTTISFFSTTAGATTLITSLTVPAQTFDATFVMTCTATVVMNATGNQFTCNAAITTFTTSSITPALENQILTNGATSAPKASTTYAAEQSLAISAGTSVTFYLYAFTGGSSTGTFQTASMQGVNLKCEVIKR